MELDSKNMTWLRNERTILLNVLSLCTNSRLLLKWMARIILWFLFLKTPGTCNIINKKYA